MYNRSIRNNLNAMVEERQRLQVQIGNLGQELTRNQYRMGHYHRSPPEARRDGLMQIVMQKVKLDADTAELQSRSR